MIELSGSYSSDDSRTAFAWAMPPYSAADLAFCKVGLHILSRKPVITGWVGYFTRVERHYCACGSKCWIKYDRSFVETETTEPNGHLHWITRQIETQAMMGSHHEWERAMSDSHPCWGDPYACISCGCGVDRPCVSHEGRPQPRIDPIAMKAAADRRDNLRRANWPTLGNRPE